MIEVKEMMTLKRKNSDLLYMIAYIENGKARIVPFDVDSKIDGAKRSWVKLENVWKIYELQ